MSFHEGKNQFDHGIYRFLCNYDKKLTLRDMNDSLSNFTGDRSGKKETLLSIIHPEDRSLFRQWIDIGVRSGEFHIDCPSIRFVNKQNETIKCSGDIEIKYENGQVMGLEGVFFDVTRMTDYQASLEIRIRQLLGIIDGTRVGTWEWYVQSGEAVFNERWAEIIGYTLKELEPVSVETWIRFTHPDDLKESKRLLEKHFKGEIDYYECETRMHHKNGDWVWVLDRGKVVKRAKNGKPYLMSGTHQDITDQKQMETALKTSRERLMDAQRIAKMGDFIWDMDTGEVSWSDAMHELLKYDRSDTKDVEQLTPRIHHPDDSERVMKWLSECIDSGSNELTPNEYRLIRKDGRIIYVRTVGIIIRKPGESTKVFGTLQDITERELARQALILSENRFRNVIESSPLGMHFYELHDHDRLVFTGANPAAGDILGFDHSTVIGKTIEEAFPPLKETEVPDRYRHVAKTGDIWTTEQVEYKDNIINGAFQVIAFQTEPDHMVAQFMDITETKKLQEALRNGEERLRITLRSIGDAVIATDMEGNITAMNPIAEKLTGWEIQSALGKPLNEVFIIVNSITGRKVENPVDKVLIEGEIVGLANHTMLISKNGKKYQIADSGSPIKNDNNRIVGVVLVFRDVTEEYRIRREIEENSLLLNSIIRQSPVPMTLVMADHTVRMVNQAGRSFLGVPHEKMLGKKLEDLSWSWKNYTMEGEFIPPEQSPIAKALRGEAEHWDSLMLVDKDGNVKYNLTEGIPVLDDQGNVIAGFIIFPDLTPMVEAQQMQKHTETIFNAFLDNSPIYIFFKDQEIRSIRLSRNYERMFGKPLSEVIGKTMYELFPSDLAEKMIEDDKRVLSEGKSIHIIEEFGGRIYETIKFPIYFENGPPMLAGYSIDITDRTKTEKALKESEALYRLLAENAGEMIWLADCLIGEIRLSYINPAVEKILGYSTDEVINMNAIDSITPDSYEEAIPFVKDMKESKESVTLQIQHIHKEGHIVDCEVFIKPIIDDEGIIIGYQGRTTDITQRLKTEKIIRENERMMRNIFENSTNVFYSHDTDQHITYVSPQSYEILGYAPGELMIKWTDLATDNPANQLGYEFTLKAIKTGESQPPYELQLRRKDGNFIWVEARENPVVEDGKTIAIVGSLNDITERKKAEKNMIESHRLNAIGEFASGVAHDFNNSLEAILGNVDLALLEPDLSETVKSYLISMQKSVMDAAGRVKKLQNFSRPALGKASAQLLRINDIINDSIHQIRPLWKEKLEKLGFSIEITKQFEQIPPVMGNESELRSVIYNLLKNAIEAMPSGGKIAIQTYLKDKKVKVLISDSGIGMDAETSGKIFQPFFSTKGYEQGRGLGLSGAYSVVRDHGGTIVVKETSPNKGTVIEMTLPAQFDS